MKNDIDLRTLKLEDTTYETRLTKKFLSRQPYARPCPSEIRAHIPGVICDLRVQPGQKVARGESLLVLEAMKMQNDLTAAVSGTVRTVHVSPGDVVPKGHLLIELDLHEHAP
ncbi:MAG TPA: acetyl-CoA carboxylase biotin carboxyl carrier protein subunit [Thermoanaerobaculia bacterium]|nr:acetyl-CoA carboxylase biotin carboxyl carrier protein subunit [Thermoanaerobaculia bacterium]HXK69669.1 acetyl-CoA carboxylase biotin carboxyl carrier protein subunit [Thermoanaerobaculia bacterium]